MPSGDSLFVSSDDAKFEFGVSFEFSEGDSGSITAIAGKDRGTEKEDKIQIASELLRDLQAELYNNFGPLESHD